MRVLVVGGSGSGKSAFAERLACSLSPSRTYVATMARDGAEAEARIGRHRAQRAGMGFATVECSSSLACAIGVRRDNTCAQRVADGVVLLDDLGNLAANALFAPDGTMAEPAAVLERLHREVTALARDYEYAVVVGNEVGCEGASRYEGTRAWVRLIGALCCQLAAEFDTVVEVVAGIPLVVKGRLP